MEPKKSKYDTNPLDPDFVKTAEEEWTGNDSSVKTGDMSERATSEIRGAGSNSHQADYTEAPTRRYDNVQVNAPYPSVFVPPTYSPPPAPYQPPATPFRATTDKPTSRTIPGIGLPEKWAIMLPYAPFYIGLVVSLLELFLVPKSEPRVRFHASQGLALYIGILFVQTLFGIVELITDSSFAGSLFKFAAFIFLIVSMVRVWKGEPHHIAPISEPAEWLNEHIMRGKKS